MVGNPVFWSLEYLYTKEKKQRAVLLYSDIWWKNGMINSVLLARFKELLRQKIVWTNILWLGTKKGIIHWFEHFLYLVIVMFKQNSRQTANCGIYYYTEVHACLQYFSVLKIPVIAGTQALLTLPSTLYKLLQLICFHTTFSFLCSPNISGIHSLGFFALSFVFLSSLPLWRPSSQDLVHSIDHI